MSKIKTNKWATDIMEHMKNQGEKVIQNNNNIFIGKIVSVNPLKVLVNGQLIEKQLFINSAYQLLSDNTTDLIEGVFDEGITIKGDFDGIQRVPKNNYPNLIVDKHIDITFIKNPIDVSWFEFLREFHKRFVLVLGDRVIMLKNETSFYVMSKVVEV